MKKKPTPPDVNFQEDWDEDESDDFLAEGRGYVTDGVSTVTTCNVTGCNQVTNHLKPVCQDHILRQPYAQKIRAELAYREKEAKWAGSKTQRWRVDPYGTRATDILLTVRAKGVLTVAKLVMELDTPRDVVEGYLEALERAGLIHRRILRTMRKLKVSIAVTAEGDRVGGGE